MATIAENIVTLDSQVAALGRRCQECGFNLDENSTMVEISKELNRLAYNIELEFSFNAPIDYGEVLETLRADMVDTVNKMYGCELNADTATIPEITAEIQPLGVELEAYAVGVYESGTSGNMQLRFLRAETAPVVGETYLGYSIAYVYSNFENTDYTSNSQIPWYSERNSFVGVYFDDEVAPITCAYWFQLFRYCTEFDIEKLDTSKATSFANMFYYCSSVSNLTLADKQTSKVTNMSFMFYYNNNMTSLDVNGWDVSNVEDFSSCFQNCSKLTALSGIDAWKISEKCTTIAYMYNNCAALESITFGEWDFTNLTNAAYAFSYCTAVKSIDLHKCTWGNALAKIHYMFYNDSKLTTIYAAPDTDLSYATSIDYTFRYASSIVGGNGTVYDSSKVTGAMARVDGLDGEEGYFTALED